MQDFVQYRPQKKQQKPNPPKDGDGKPRVLSFLREAMDDSPEDPKIAELPIDSLRQGG